MSISGPFDGSGIANTQVNPAADQGAAQATQNDAQIGGRNLHAPNQPRGQAPAPLRNPNLRTAPPLDQSLITGTGRHRQTFDVLLSIFETRPYYETTDRVFRAAVSNVQVGVNHGQDLQSAIMHSIKVMSMSFGVSKAQLTDFVRQAGLNVDRVMFELTGNHNHLDNYVDLRRAIVDNCPDLNWTDATEVIERSIATGISRGWVPQDVVNRLIDRVEAGQIDFDTANAAGARRLGYDELVFEVESYHGAANRAEDQNDGTAPPAQRTNWTGKA